MPRRTAADRFSDLTPSDDRPSGEVLAQRISALASPERRRLWETLGLQGPATVGHLARATGMAVGSASHHLRVLARAGFVEPAPGLAGDTRESWWRQCPGTNIWSSQSFAPGTAGERLARLATAANLEHLLDAARRGIIAEQSDSRREGSVCDALVHATDEELAAFGEQLAALLEGFAASCRDSQEQAPQRPRRPVRAIGLVFVDASRG